MVLAGHYVLEPSLAHSLTSVLGPWVRRAQCTAVALDDPYVVNLLRSGPTFDYLSTLSNNALVAESHDMDLEATTALGLVRELADLLAGSCGRPVAIHLRSKVQLRHTQ